MAVNPIEKILNANVYLDDTNFIGRALEVEIAKVSVKTTEHQTLAMVGPLELFQGIEKLEAKIKWAAFSSDVLSKLVPTRATKLTIRVAQQEYKESSVIATKQVRAIMVGRLKEQSVGTLKAGEGEVETVFAVDYFKKVVDGKDVLEIDIPNYIYRVDGEDIYEEVRTALGI